jgi:hypothetical protein
MEENNNGQGFWVESNFEPNPNYQPRHKSKKHSEEEPERRSDRKTDRQAQRMRSQSEDIMSRSRGLLQILSTYLPGLSTVMTLGSGLSSLFGGFGKLLKWGCLILVVGFVVIVALLVGVATCMGTDDESKGSSSQTEVVADTTAVTAQPSEPEPEPMAPEPEAPEVEEQQVEEPEAAEPEIEAPKAEEPEVVEPVKPVKEPEPQQQAKPKPRKRTTTQEPKKKKGTGFRLEKVDHIPRPQ